MLLGVLLKTLRKKKGYTSQQLADALHVSRSTYSRYENNLKLVEEDILNSLATFYGTTVNDIIKWHALINEPEYPFNIYKISERS